MTLEHYIRLSFKPVHGLSFLTFWIIKGVKHNIVKKPSRQIVMFWMRCKVLLGWYSQGTKPAHFHEFSGMQSTLKMAGGFKER